MKVSAGFVFSEASPLDMQMAVFSPHLHVDSAPRASVSKAPLLVRTPVVLDEGPP